MKLQVMEQDDQAGPGRPAEARLPEPAPPRRVVEEREPLFDIHDFLAIARFAGILPPRRRPG
ncbi:hypothetical protein [Paracraurococcus ruber]|uniref:Transposase n=1 Tax=Paracraurococcus ruber TaxID=77675 RepID=A0ABS1CWH3_9PROT|nr:hypothetical protein [Paracraurococcus ruber]MBK1658723.1 hypothetical protein [Paracraurococcus ruber]TDG30067.1 hypothetical protein E2C05_15820 [Paracraurococcus ruber]